MAVYQGMIPLTTTIQQPPWANTVPPVMGAIGPGALRQAKPRSFSRLWKAQLDLTHKAIRSERHGNYFCLTYVEDAIKTFDWWNPILNGRPKAFAQLLLEGIPAPTRDARRCYFLKNMGLMYLTPFIVSVRSTRGRTTSAGLALCKYWAAQSPKFKLFFDAYYTKKAEFQITCDSVDFSLGMMPYWYRKDMAKNEKNYHIAQEKEKARFEEEARQQAQYNQLAQQYNGPPLSPLHGQLLGAGSQLYGAQMQQNLTATQLAQMKDAQQSLLGQSKTSILGGMLGRLI